MKHQCQLRTDRSPGQPHSVVTSARLTWNGWTMFAWAFPLPADAAVDVSPPLSLFPLFSVRMFNAYKCGAN